MKVAADIEILGSKTIKGIRASAASGEAVEHDQLQSTILASLDVVVVDTGVADITAYFAQVGISFSDYKSGDVLYMPNATNLTERFYIHNGGTAGDITDWTNIQGNISAADVESFFTGEDIHADSIKLSSGYDASVASGDVAIGDTIEQALAKIEAKTAAISAQNYAQPIATTANTPLGVTHNLGSTNLFVMAYDLDQPTPDPIQLFDYSIVDNNSMTVTTSVSYPNLQLVIMSV